MTPAFHPQEIFLLERYISPEYFCELRDTWEDMLTHLESCLNRFMLNLPKDYRARSLPEQPDVVWGNRVLPNFRNTLQGLQTGFILLTHQDPSGLSYAWGVKSDFKGQMDFWSGWMERADENVYEEFLNKAVMLASNICRTERAGWEPFDLVDYNEYWGPLDAPLHWPNYRVQKEVCVATGARIGQSGVYVPDVEASCAEFLYIAYETAPPAKVRVGINPVYHPNTGEKYDEAPVLEDRCCTWYLIERGPEDQRDKNEDYAAGDERIRVPGGGTCPEGGFYFTPAKLNSRRLFQKGDLMPDLGSEYGLTIWQWDSSQAP